MYYRLAIIMLYSNDGAIRNVLYVEILYRKPAKQLCITVFNNTIIAMSQNSHNPALFPQDS